jgi:large subunit ribosomal protein L23
MQEVKIVKNTNLYSCILSKNLTDKTYKIASLAKDESFYSFYVNPKSSKKDIKLAMEQIFDVKVKSISTLRRTKLSKSFKGVRSSKVVKIAYVYLLSGSINI